VAIDKRSSLVSVPIPSVSLCGCGSEVRKEKIMVSKQKDPRFIPRPRQKLGRLLTLIIILRRAECASLAVKKVTLIDFILSLNLKFECEFEFSKYLKRTKVLFVIYRTSQI
jgi:hypothetical protein